MWLLVLFFVAIVSISLLFICVEFRFGFVANCVQFERIITCMLIHHSHMNTKKKKEREKANEVCWWFYGAFRYFRNAWVMIVALSIQCIQHNVRYIVHIHLCYLYLLYMRACVVCACMIVFLYSLYVNPTDSIYSREWFFCCSVHCQRHDYF